MFRKGIRNFSSNLVVFKSRSSPLKPNKPANPLEFLSSAYQEKKVEKQSEKLEVPKNVKDAFYRKYHMLSRNLSGDTSVDLLQKDAFPLIMELIQDLKTPEELELSQEVLEMWRRSGRLFSRSKSVTMLDTFFKENLQNAMFDVLCSKYLFGLKPDSGHITKLLKHYASLSLSDKETHIPNLDMAYKCFALYLYYDIPPSKTGYHYLIAAGLYGGTEEGIARSVITEKERDALGWKPLVETDYAWAHYYYLEKKYDQVLERLENIDTIQSVIFKSATFCAQGHLGKAKEIAAGLEAKKTDHALKATIGSELWISRQDLDKLLTQ
jgi:hypothetical protein